MGFGGRTGFHKKIIDVQVGGRGGITPLGPLELFLAILAQPGEFSGSLLECKVLKKSVPYPDGARPEAIWRAYFGRTPTRF